MNRRPNNQSGPTEIVIVGGGYVGMYAARRLQQRLNPSEASITVIDPQPNMTYQPFLPEVAAGSLEARHAVLPLRRVLKDCHVLTGAVSSVDPSLKSVSVLLPEGGDVTIAYDTLIMTPGSVSRIVPIPGLAEESIGFKTVAEAVHLRNHVLRRLDRAAGCTEPAERQRALTFAVIGGGYAGVEVAGELEDLARSAIRLYPELSVSNLNWLLIEASNRILPEVGDRLGDYTLKQLRKRDIDVRLETRVRSMTDGHLELSDGTAFDADTLIWTAGVQAHVLARASGLPVDRAGRLRCSADLRVEGRDDVWAAGDCAAVPDVSSKDPTALCSPSAQHAVRQAKRLAENVTADLRGSPARAYRHRHVGSVASLGLYRGVAEIYGIRVRGLPAWLMHRAYHLSRLPSVGQMFRVAADWLMAFFFGRELTALDSPALRCRVEAGSRAAEAGPPSSGQRPSVNPRPPQTVHQGCVEHDGARP